MVSRLLQVITAIRNDYPEASLLAVGYSLGGVLLTHYLREKGDTAQIDAGISISVPFHLPTSYNNLMSFSTTFVVNMFLCSCLVRRLSENRQVLESSVSIDNFEQPVFLLSCKVSDRVEPTCYISS